jgi:hypothetical protein
LKGKGKVQGQVCFDLARLEIGGKFESAANLNRRRIWIWKRVEGGNLNGKERKIKRRKERKIKGRTEGRTEGRKEEKKEKRFRLR